ncbi:hypothetical protein IAT38_007004 [Cryptococcus sp. DSM 104549]
MSLHFDYAEISRQARRIVDANRARTVIDHVSSASGSSSSQPAKLKFSRTTTGCRACRKHKVKCDETIPTCLRCVASQRECEYPPKTEGRKRKSRTAGDGGETIGSARGGGQGSGASKANGVGGEGDSERGNGTGEGEKKVRLEGPCDGQATEQLAQGGMGALGVGAGPGGMAATTDPSPLNDTTVSPVDGSYRMGVSPTDAAMVLGTPDFSFLNDFIPFISPPNPVPPAPFSQTSPNAVIPLTAIASAAASASSSRPLPNINKSLLMNRRLARVGDTSKERTPSVPLPSTHPRLQMVEVFLQAFTDDEVLFEFGPSHRHRNLSNNTLTAGTIDVLSNAFPSPTARTLFHHYCNTASRILITMGNIGPNPLLALCTPLKLLDTNSAASAAIRMSMLSAGVAHFTHETADAVSKEELGRHWEAQRQTLKEMGNKFKKAALSNITLAARSETSPEQIDSILAACTLLCIRDVISADPTWRDNLEFAINLINKKGGPQAMLNGQGYSFTRRYLLENLATHDVFASFITGKEPAMLGNYDSWWFDSVETSQTRWEWESVERSFGISRAMVDLVARIAGLDSQKRRLGVSLKGGSDEMWDVAQHFERESHCLLLELDIWGNSLNALPQHVRVTCGDYIYKYMAVVYILADILEQPITTPRIVKSIDYIFELISEATAMRMSVMLIWPLIIAGAFCLPDRRTKVRELFEAFQPDYCEDLDVARELVEEQWKAIDAGLGKQPWDKIMNQVGRYALLI